MGAPELLRAPDAEFLTAGAILDLKALSLCWALPPSPTISSLSKFNFIHLTPEKWKRKKITHYWIGGYYIAGEILGFSKQLM